MRRRATVVVLIAAVLAAVALSRRGGDTPLDELPGLDRETAAFEIRPGGGLFRSRVVADEDGAPNTGYVFEDLPLIVGVTARKPATVAAIEIRVDGRPQGQRRAGCRAGRCPRRAQWTTTPSLAALPAGEHRVAIVVTGPRASDGRAARATHSFRVRTGNAPPPSAEAAVRPAASGAVKPALSATARRRALRVVRSAWRSGPLAAAVGRRQPLVIALGSLEIGARRRGATALVQLRSVRRKVAVRVPAYTVRGRGRIVPTSVNLRARELRDLLIDVDLTTGRVIAIEPGPLSRTERWQPAGPLPQPGVEDED